MNERSLQAASETGFFVFYGFSDTIVPGVVSTEMHFWENAQKFDMTRLVPFMEVLLAQ